MWDADEKIEYIFLAPNLWDRVKQELENEMDEGECKYGAYLQEYSVRYVKQGLIPV